MTPIGSDLHQHCAAKGPQESELINLVQERPISSRGPPEVMSCCEGDSIYLRPEYKPPVQIVSRNKETQ
jgi:hypothetical protein